MIKNVELLMPAGNFEAFLQALHNGADAVYLGMKQFSARASSNNFSNQEFIEAIKLAHLADMNIYVTINTLLMEDEIDEVIELIDFLYQNGADGIIIQDLGLLEIVSHRYPLMEIHISTQMFIHNVHGVQLLKNLGVDRVVIARETPIEVIREICQLDIDIEAFVYGALCTSYSGQCLISSVTKNRSANKGRCAQLCRLPYNLVDETNNQIIADNQYLLSLKDLNLIDNIDDIIDANVKSFKIEGRMKRPEYVGEVCRTFRDKIDSHYQSSGFVKNNQHNLKKLFNRGFTHGFVYNDDVVFNHFRPNHLGIEIGSVISNKNNRIQVKLTHDLHQHDGIRIINKNEDFGMIANRIYLNDLLVNQAGVNDVIELDVNRKFNVGDKLLLTSDVKQLEEIGKYVNDYYRKRTIKLEIMAHIDQVMRINVIDGSNTYWIIGDEIIQKANKNPLDHQRLLQQFNKIGVLPFLFEADIDFNGDIFVSINQINKLKRAIIDCISLVKQNKYYNRRIVDGYQMTPFIETTAISIVEVDKLEQQVLQKGDIYVTNNPSLNIEKLPLLVDEFGTNKDSRFINSLNDLLNSNEEFKIATPFLNITNSYALALAYRLGIKLAFLSFEVNQENTDLMIDNFIKRYGFVPNVGLFEYGRRNMMTMKYCPIQSTLNTSRHCNLCQKNQYAMIQGGERFPIFSDYNCKIILLEDQPYHNQIKNKYINNFYYRYTLE